jgi:hypothetical protein
MIAIVGGQSANNDVTTAQTAGKAHLAGERSEHGK